MAKNKRRRLIMSKLIRHTLFSLALLCGCFSYHGQVITMEGTQNAQQTGRATPTPTNRHAKSQKEKKPAHKASPGGVPSGMAPDLMCWRWDPSLGKCIYRITPG